MSIQDDITRLARPAPAAPSLDTPATPTAIRSKVGLERQALGKVNSEEVTVKSTDGLFTFTVKVVKS